MPFAIAEWRSSRNRRRCVSSEQEWPLILFFLVSCVLWLCLCFFVFFFGLLPLCVVQDCKQWKQTVFLCLHWKLGLSADYLLEFFSCMSDCVHAAAAAVVDHRDPVGENPTLKTPSIIAATTSACRISSAKHHCKAACSLFVCCTLDPEAFGVGSRYTLETNKQATSSPALLQSS